MCLEISEVKASVVLLAKVSWCPVMKNVEVGRRKAGMRDDL